MKKKKITFLHVISDLEKAHGYDNEYDLDYFHGDEDKEPLPYDDYYSITTFGSNEGIYVDFYVLREKDGRREHIATAKTLFEGEPQYFKMHELGAKVCLELRKKSIP